MRSHSKGFLCPVCNSKTKVIDTRAVGKDWRRRRKCPNNHRFTTYESLSLKIVAKLHNICDDFSL